MAKKQVDKYKPRKDGRYETKVSTGKYTDDGKPIRTTLYANTSRELENLVAKARYEIEKGIYIKDTGQTFRQYAEMWLSVSKKTKSLRTNAMYKNILKNHINRLEDKKLIKITRMDIQQQINDRIDMPRLCQQIKITIDQVLESAVIDGLILKNPCIGIELPRRITKKGRALTKQEKAALKSADFTIEEKAFIFTLYGCGLRPEELYALTKADISIKKREIHINKALVYDGVKPILSYTKTKSGERTVQAPKLTIEALREWMDKNNQLILFPDDKGNYRTRSGYYNIFSKIRNKIVNKTNSDKSIHDASISPLTQYTFRHNYCTELYYAGVSLKECQRLMGHSDYSMVMKVYAHLDELKEDTKTKIEAINF